MRIDEIETRLAEIKTEIENPEIDLTAYLGSETRGEVSVVVELGQKTFIKVVVGRTSLTTFEKGDDK